MRVKRLRKILDGPFLLAEEPRAESQGRELRRGEDALSRQQPGEGTSDSAERED